MEPVPRTQSVLLHHLSGRKKLQRGAAATAAAAHETSSGSHSAMQCGYTRVAGTVCVCCVDVEGQVLGFCTAVVDSRYIDIGVIFYNHLVKRHDFLL